MDAKAHWYPGHSPFNFSLNNPVMFVDPNGMWVKGGGFLANVFHSDDWVAERMAQKYADATGGELERKEYGWRVHEPIKESGDGLLGEVGFKDFDVARMSGKNSGGESSGDSGQGGGWFYAANGGLAVGELARQGKIYEIYGRSAQSVENALSNGQYVHTNGKTYRQGFRGNQYVSSKSVSNSLSTAKLAKNIGRGITGLSVGISLYQFGTSKQTEAEPKLFTGVTACPTHETIIF